MEIRGLLQKKVGLLESCSKEAFLSSAAALSQMTGEIINVGNPYVEVVKNDKILSFMEKDSDKITLIRLNICGILEGDICLVLSDDHTKELIEKVASKNLPGKMAQDLSDSILGEVENIVAVSYINVLGETFGTVLLPSIPYLSFLESKDTLYETLFGNGKATKYGLTLTCKFHIGGRGIDLVFLLLLISGSLDFLMEEV
jgi:chemotaxis protein CheY-P-specific phosphatase CheC